MPFPSVLRKKSSDKISKDVSRNSSESPESLQNSKVAKYEQHDSKANPDLKVEGLSISPVETEKDPSAERPISVEDIKLMFSGAPHFTLEPGQNGRAHPQVFFPWSTKLETADLMDRKLMRHESFASATLHPHLPVKSSSSENSSPIEPVHRSQAGKRPEFEIGTFEVPNMLDYEGKEPGTIGMRHFLEIPVSDSLRTEGQVKDAANAARAAFVARLTSMDAQKAMLSGEYMMNVGKTAAWQDRFKFIHGDRKSWRELGLRNLNMSVIKSRIAVLGPWYDEMAKEGWKGTILDRLDSDTLYDELFTLMLYPPSRVADSSDRGLGVQIKALVSVLSTPGAWFDFSLVEWRLRLGQLLWEVPINEKAVPDFDPGAQRHWLLVQILLSIELAIRLDAALRCGKVHLSEGVLIPDLKPFQSLRTEKVDWDIILARGFLDHVYVEDYPSTHPLTRPVLDQRKVSGLFSRWKQRKENSELGGTGSAWDCLILPRHLEVQVQGLLRFAKTIHWPNIEEFENLMIAKEQRYASATTPAAKQTFVHPLECPDARAASVIANGRISQLSPLKKQSKTNGLPANLQPASQAESGGWLSRSWFAGLIMPGESISHFLIAALLEQSEGNITKIGSQGNLYGGFILNGQSWWSKVCVVGKVLAACDGGRECMGWISTRNVQAVDQLHNLLSDGWLTVGTHKPRTTSGKPRICAGRAISEDSSPLGIGKGRATLKDFHIPVDESSDKQKDEVELENLVLQHQDAEDSLVASVVFRVKATNLSTPVKIEMELAHNIDFVSSYACRVPMKEADLSSNEAKEIPGFESGETLPGHPLHKSFIYSIKSISDLLAWVPPIPTSADKQGSEVWIVDARGAGSRQLLARAWCSKVGRNAIVSRVGRTCLTCSIREAKALDISVIIRIGHSG